MKLNNGWYIYANSDIKNQIKAFIISWTYNRIYGIPANQVKETVIKDKIFGNKFTRICTGKLEYIQPIQLEGRIPRSIKIYIHGFAANG